MGLQSIFVAALGVAIAGGSAYGAREYMSAGAAALSDQQPQSQLVDVVIAARDIPFGQVLQPQMLQVMPWPREALPPGAVTDISTLLAPAGQPQRRAKRAFAQGELLLASKLSDFGEKVTIVQNLGPNSRAMAIRVDAVTAVGGFVTPGDTVDILLTQGRDTEMQSVTILQNIRVIGVDQDADEQSDKPEVARTVTVEVTPDEGQKLALAQRAGTLSLTLRTLDAAVDAPIEAVRLSDLMLNKSPVVETAERTSVRIRRANELVETVPVD